MKGDKVMDFITIDFEIANSDYSSACSMGMVFVKDKKIVDEKYYLIQPPSMIFDNEFTEIHGIQPSDVIDSPTFDQVWKEIIQYFTGDTYIVAHNAQFDLNVLRNCLDKYNLDIPDFEYVCSIPISTRACRGEGVGQSLKDRLSHFGLAITNHHNALDDSRACAELVIRCLDIKKRRSLDSYLRTFTSVPIKTFKNIKVQRMFFKRSNKFKSSVSIKDITPTEKQYNSNHPFFKKNIVLTGELDCISRNEAMQKIVNLGGILKSGVSRKTDYLILGKQDPKLVGPSGISSKEKKAIELIENGIEIKIIKDTEFLRLIRT